MKENDINVRPDKIDYNKYIFLIISRWYIILFCALLGLFSGYLINRYKVQIYQVSMSLIFENDENTSFADFLSPMRYSRRKRMPDLQNEITKMQSYTVTRRTLEKLDFNVSYYGIGRVKETPLYKTNSIEVIPLSENNPEIPFHIAIMKDGKYSLSFEKNDLEVDTTLRFGQIFNKNGFIFKINSKTNSHHTKEYKCIIHNLDNLTKKYQYGIHISNDDLNEFKINLSLRGHIPEKMVNYLNSFANEYLGYSLEQKNEQSLKTLDFIEQQIAYIEDSLAIIEQQIINYKLQQDVVDLDLQSQLALDKFQVFQSQKTNIEFKQKYYNYLREHFEENADPRKLITLSMAGIDEPMLSGLLGDFEDIYKEQLSEASIVKKELPGFWHYDSKMDKMKSLILDKVEGVMQSNEESLIWIKQEIGKAKEEIRALPISETDFLKIDRTYQLYNKYYTFLLEKRAEGGIEKASQSPDSRILDIARIENAFPLGTSNSKILLICTAFGFLLPVIVFILLDLINKKIISKDDIVRNTDIPILGLLGHNQTESGIPVFEDPRSRLTEAFRRVRTDMRFYLHGENEKTILITSAISGEGKSFVTLNLALISAMASKKVLLMGMDLRKPSIHKVFNISNKKGMSSYLIGRNEISEIIIKSNINNLDIVPSGPIPPNPVELLETDRMKEFFDTVQNDYDLIFIDTPPLAVVTDAQILSKYTSLCIFVLRQKYSHKDVFTFINGLHDQQKFNRLALLVNDMEPSRTLGYNYSYGYSYSYGYGYGYRSNETYYYYKNKTDEEEEEDI